MMKIILNRLKPEAEKIIAEEQAGFRPGRSTTEKIFNLRILCERYLQHQQDLYHVFIEKTKLMINNTNGISSNIRVNGEKLKAVQGFKYLGAMVAGGGSVPGMRSGIAHNIAALSKLKII